MADKDGNRYRYEPYPSQPLAKQQNNGTNSLKRGTTMVGDVSVGVGVSGSKGGTPVGVNGNNSVQKRRCCTCMGPKSASFWAGLLTNLGICTLLFAYTLLGKRYYNYFIIFLAKHRHFIINIS